MNGTSIWKCSQYKRLKCRGSVTITDTSVIKYKIHHPSCHPNEEQNKHDLECYKLLMKQQYENMQMSQQEQKNLWFEVSKM